MNESLVAQFQVLGFQVYIRTGFLVVCGFFLLLALSNKDPLWAAASFPAVLFVSIIIHELGHALMCRRLSVRLIGGVELHGFGGHVTHTRSTAKNQLKISLAGPAAGLMFGLPFLIPYFFIELPRVPQVVIFDILWINVGWSLVNLIPMKPLDGGNAFHAVMDMYTDARQAAYVTGVVGLILGIVIAGVAWRLYMPVLGIIGIYVAYSNVQAIQQSQGAFR